MVSAMCASPNNSPAQPRKADIGIIVGRDLFEIVDGCDHLLATA